MKERAIPKVSWHRPFRGTLLLRLLSRPGQCRLGRIDYERLLGFSVTAGHFEAARNGASLIFTGHLARRIIS